MSAWYIFSVMGFYPLTPASGEYALGIPAFEEFELALSNGNRLKIVARDRKKHQTMEVVRFNGKRLDRPFIPVREIMQGGVLEFSTK